MGNKSRRTKRMRSSPDLHKGIIFIIVGLIASVGILIANQEDIVIPEIITDMNVEVWELAFGVNMLFIVGGVIAEMIATTGGVWGMEDYQNLMITILMYPFSMFFLDAINFGVLSASATSMRAEINSWFLYYALLIASHLIWLFIKKR